MVNRETAGRQYSPETAAHALEAGLDGGSRRKERKSHTTDVGFERSNCRGISEKTSLYSIATSLYRTLPVLSSVFVVKLNSNVYIWAFPAVET